MFMMFGSGLTAITYATFSVLALLAAGLQFLSLQSPNTEIFTGNNPIFLKFQRQYFSVYFIALFADWLHGPYLYKLYTHYGFLEKQIAIIYVSGYFTVCGFGAVSGYLVDRMGRKQLCLAFCVIYTVASIAKLSQNYFVLICGRILGGIALSLMPAFENWYTYEHIETNGFPSEWISVTYAKASLWNGILAVIAGIVANTFAEWLSFGPVAPFVVSIPCLIVCAILVSKFFNENHSTRQVKFGRNCFEGLRSIVRKPEVFLIGCIQALFEASLAVLVFVWTPILDVGAAARPPLGICFSCFMLCIVAGDAVYRILKSKKVPTQHILTGSIFLALVSMICAAGAVHPKKPKYIFAFFTFLVYEVAAGMYFPAMNSLRSITVAEAYLPAIMNWFRIPLNALACIGLIVLHEDEKGNHIIFIICSVFLAIALSAVLALQKRLSSSKNAPLMDSECYLPVLNSPSM